MSYYHHHVFMCTNRREDGSPCCGQFGARESRTYLKRRTKELGISEPGKVRINSAGCFGRCGEGPVLVIYPEGVWYTYVDREDLEEILQTHLLEGKILERLRLPESP